MDNLRCNGWIVLLWTLHLLLPWVTQVADAETTLGAPAVWRAKEDIVQKAVLLVDPSMRALQAGVLVGWNVFTARGRRSQRVYLQVWRPVDVNRRAYRLVGETKIAALWVGHSFFPLRPPDRILVEPGDVLGLHFPRFNPIPWSPVPCDRNNEHFFKYNPSRLLAMKGTIVFDRPAHDWMPCRNYSFNASIMTTREMELWDASYENDTIGRYEFRPYGDHIPTRRSDVNGSTSLSTSLSSLAIFLVVLIVVIFGANL